MSQNYADHLVERPKHVTVGFGDVAGYEPPGQQKVLTYVYTSYCSVCSDAITNHKNHVDFRGSSSNVKSSAFGTNIIDGV